MITNERQYKITNAGRNNLKEQLKNLLALPEVEAGWINTVRIDALKSQISELGQEIREYDILKSGQIKHTEVGSLGELPLTLIRARISSGMTQSDLAAALDLKAQQIQRYEATSYQGVSLHRLVEIAEILGVKVTGEWGGEADRGANVIFSWNKIEDLVWERFPIKEMVSRNWISPKSNIEMSEVVRRYFTKVAGPKFATAMHRKKFYGTNRPNEFALLAWQTRVLEKANISREAQELSDFEYDDTWLGDLVSLTKEERGPRLAQAMLAKKGIALVIERHLAGTYLDGAAMLSNSDNPVIGLTLRHDRLDNFWFVLFHELGHVFLHLSDGLGLDFFDEDDDAESDQIEREADQFALNALIPEEGWTKSLSRFLMTEQAVKRDAEKLGVDPSIVAGRIRKEKNDYTILNDLIGLGEVRKLFEG